MTIVVDASVVVPAALTASWSRRLERQHRAAPSLLWSEAASSLRQLRYREEIDDALVARGLDWLRQANVETHASADLIDEAMALAIRLGWAKTYDAEYVVLAQRLNAPLVTIDARLARAVDGLVAVLPPGEL